MLTEIPGSLFPGDLALPEMLHHLNMFMLLRLFEVETVESKKQISGGKGGAFVSIYKRMVTGNAFSISRRKLKDVVFTVGMQI